MVITTVVICDPSDRRRLRKRLYRILIRAHAALRSGNQHVSPIGTRVRELNAIRHNVRAWGASVPGFFAFGRKGVNAKKYLLHVTSREVV